CLRLAQVHQGDGRPHPSPPPSLACPSERARVAPRGWALPEPMINLQNLTHTTLKSLYCCSGCVRLVLRQQEPFGYPLKQQPLWSFRDPLRTTVVACAHNG